MYNSRKHTPLQTGDKPLIQSLMRRQRIKFNQANTTEGRSRAAVPTLIYQLHRPLYSKPQMKLKQKNSHQQMQDTMRIASGSFIAINPRIMKVHK